MYRKMFLKNLNTAIVVVMIIKKEEARTKSQGKGNKWRSKKHKAMGSRGKRR